MAARSANIPVNTSKAAVPLTKSPTEIPAINLTTKASVASARAIPRRVPARPLIGVAKVVMVARSASIPTKAIMAAVPLRISPAERPEMSFITMTSIASDAAIPASVAPSPARAFPPLVIFESTDMTATKATIAASPLTISLRDILDMSLITPVIIKSDADSFRRMFPALEISAPPDPLDIAPYMARIPIRLPTMIPKPAIITPSLSGSVFSRRLRANVMIRID